MDTERAADLLARLGNDTRLRIVRLLVRAGHGGLPAGGIQRQLGIPSSTLSHHLANLRHAELVEQRREGTVLRYTARYDRIEALVAFLTAECCAGVEAPPGPPVEENTAR